MTPAKTMFIQIGRKRYQIESLKQASEMFSAARDKYAMLGRVVRKLPLIVDDRGDVIAHVSYNGRVWRGLPRDWQSGVQPLYDNRAA